MEKIYKIKITLLFLVFSLLPLAASAATLNFSPSSGAYAVGNTISVAIYASSADQAMNAASGVVSFPQDKLEVVSLSKNNSIFTFWAQEPSFSNSSGTIDFEGIVMSPGFTGTNGKIITATFRIKAAGTAPLTFSSGSVLANDGNGTDILTDMGNAQFSFNEASVQNIPVASTVPAAPQISSPTHPDPNKWYDQTDAKFTWATPSDVTAVRVLVSKDPQSIPTVVYTPAISEKDVSGLDDGIWYFSAQFRNASGWGAISHFRFQTDTEKPTSFDIAEVPRNDPTEPNATFLFDAKDKTSGIDHYEIRVDNGSVETWNDDGSHNYKTGAIDPGKYTLIAKAVDKAGNSLASSADFTIEALNPPIISEYSKELQSGQSLNAAGSTYPSSEVTIWVQGGSDSPKNYMVGSDNTGKFTFTSNQKMNAGTYNIWAEVIDGRGAKSLPSSKIAIIVQKSSIFTGISLFTVAVSLVVIIAVLFFILWYGWYKSSVLRKRLRKEVDEAEATLHKVFNLLKKGLRNQIKMLEIARTKRQLTEEEEEIIRQLKEDLNAAEKSVKKEIKDIKKAIK